MYIDSLKRVARNPMLEKENMLN